MTVTLCQRNVLFILVSLKTFFSLQYAVDVIMFIAVVLMSLVHEILNFKYLNNCKWEKKCDQILAKYMT